MKGKQIVAKANGGQYKIGADVLVARPSGKNKEWVIISQEKERGITVLPAENVPITPYKMPEDPGEPYVFVADAQWNSPQHSDIVSCKAAYTDKTRTPNIRWTRMPTEIWGRTCSFSLRYQASAYLKMVTTPMLPPDQTSGWAVVGKTLCRFWVGPLMISTGVAAVQHTGDPPALSIFRFADICTSNPNTLEYTPIWESSMSPCLDEEQVAAGSIHECSVDFSCDITVEAAQDAVIVHCGEHGGDITLSSCRFEADEVAEYVHWRENQHPYVQAGYYPEAAVTGTRSEVIAIAAPPGAGYYNENTHDWEISPDWYPPTDGWTFKGKCYVELDSVNIVG